MDRKRIPVAALRRAQESMADPARYNPPLTLWGHCWRTTLCLAVSGLAWFDIAQAQWDQAPGLFVLDLLLGLASFVLVFWRRRWPFAIALLTNVLSLASVSAAGPAALALVSLATRRRLPQILLAGAVGIVTGQLFYYYEPQADADSPLLNFTFAVAVTIALSAIGMYIGSRRELLWTLRERARQAEATSALRTEQARLAERERIAREMHDVLAHRISLVAMHAGALAFRTDLPPEQLRETAGLIQAKAHEALGDLRQVLGMLRDGDVGHRPQPVLSDLALLVDEAVAGGAQVELRNHVATEPPEQIGRTAYRIVQEALTNARKHGQGAIRVSVRGEAGRGIDVVVRNGKRFGVPDGGSPPESGFGLVGLRERASLVGGRLETEETQEAFTLTGWLPWPT